MTFGLHASGAAKAAIDETVPSLVHDLVASRITAGDAELWGPDAAAEAAVRLGWVEAVSVSRPLVPEIAQLRAALDGVPADADVSPEVHADPPEAVFSGDDGLELMPKVVELAALLSAPHSAVGIEHDDSNGEGVQKLMHEAGMIDVQQHDDLAGRPRFVSAHVQRDPAYIPPQV